MQYHALKVQHITEKIRQHMEHGVVVELPEDEPVGYLEKCLTQYIKTGTRKVHIQYEKADAKVVERWLTIQPLRDANHVKATFSHLECFAEECIEQLMQRFPTHGAARALSMFDIGWEYSAVAFKSHCAELARFFVLDEATLQTEMRQLWDHRTALVAKTPDLEDEPLKLWPQVLELTADIQIHAARTVCGAFLVRQSESAACERAFARAEYIRGNLHEQKDGQLVEQYLWIGQGPPLQKASKIIDGALARYMDVKERRVSGDASQRVYFKGRRTCVSKRRVRSDAGTKGIRRKYAMVKRHCRVRKMSVVGGKKTSGEVEAVARMEVAAEGAVVPTIEIAMSPLKRRKTAKSVDSDVDVDM